MKISNKYIILNNNLSFRNPNKIEQSFLKSANDNNISNYKKVYNTNIVKNLKTKDIKHKSIPLLYLTNIENKVNNKNIQEYNTKKYLSPKSKQHNKLSSFYDSTNLTNSKIKSMVQQFEQNKISTKMLIKSEKKMKLNSLNNISEENIKFLLSDGYNKEENKKHRTINNQSNSYRLCWKLIKLFNIKTNNIFNSYEDKAEKLKKITNKFNSTEIIDSFKKIDVNKYNIKKLKQRYNETNEIIENIDEEKVRKAKKLEKDFYQLKNEETSKRSEIKRKKILRKTFFLSSKNNQEFKRALDIKKLTIRPVLSVNSESKTDENLLKAHLSYNEYFQKKVKLNATVFDENIKKLINTKNHILNSSYFDEETKKMKMMSEDILRIRELNKIKYKNKVDEYKNKYKNLKNRMNKCEDEYYRVCCFNNKNFNLSFLKPKLRQKTIKKCQRIQVCSFGIP